MHKDTEGLCHEVFTILLGTLFATQVGHTNADNVACITPSFRFVYQQVRWYALYQRESCNPTYNFV